MVALLKNKPSMRSADYWAERRIFERKETSALVRGHRIDHSISARQFPTLQMTLRDLSLGGLSAVADRPVDAGERLAVNIPSSGFGGLGWAAFGTVLRCEETGTGYRLAVEFDSLPAA